MDKDVVKKIVEVLDRLIGELSPQMGARRTMELFYITEEIERMIKKRR